MSCSCLSRAFCFGGKMNFSRLTTVTLFLTLILGIQLSAQADPASNTATDSQGFIYYVSGGRILKTNPKYPSFSQTVLLPENFSAWSIRVNRSTNSVVIIGTARGPLSTGYIGPRKISNYLANNHMEAYFSNECPEVVTEDNLWGNGNFSKRLVYGECGRQLPVSIYLGVPLELQLVRYEPLPIEADTRIFATPVTHVIAYFNAPAKNGDVFYLYKIYREKIRIVSATSEQECASKAGSNGRAFADGDDACLIYELPVQTVVGRYSKTGQGLAAYVFNSTEIVTDLKIIQNELTGQNELLLTGFVNANNTRWYLDLEKLNLIARQITPRAVLK